MKSLKTILEVWEHPFSGKDYHEDDHPKLHDRSNIGYSMSPDALGTYEKETGVHKLGVALAKHYKGGQLSEEHEKVLKRYKTGSHDINISLIHPDRFDDHWREWNNIDHVIAKMDDITKHQTTPRDMHLYSGIGFDPRKITHGQTDNGMMKVHLPAYTSTSIYPSVASSFTETNMVKIHVPKGSHGVYIHPGNSLGTTNTHGKEFVLPRGSKLHIHPEPTQHYRKGQFASSNEHLLIWHAKLVHDGVQPTRHADE